MSPAVGLDRARPVAGGVFLAAWLRGRMVALLLVVAVAVALPAWRAPMAVLSGVVAGVMALVVVSVAAGVGLRRRGAPSRVGLGPPPPALAMIVRGGLALDGGIVAVVVGLLVAQGGTVILRARSVSEGVIDLVPIVAVLLLATVLRAAVLVRPPIEAVVFGIVAGICLVVLAVLDASRGWLLPAAGHPWQVLLVLMLWSAGLSLGALLPALRTVDPGPLREQPLSRQFLAVVPVWLVPVGLRAAARFGELPPVARWVYPAALLVASALLLARAVTTLRGAEWIIENDMVTLVANPVGMARALSDRRQRAGEGPLSLCLVALDDFKRVNDSEGGARGDALLRMVAQRMAERLGPRATVGRLGGDRFLALLPSHDEVGEDVLGVFTEPFRLDGRAIPLTASVGVTAVGPRDDMNAVLGRADQAGHAAKSAGKAIAVTYGTALHEQLSAPQRMVQELRDLLDGRRADQVGRIVIRYQPIVELLSRRVVGCEALVRWQHPRGQMIMPDSFLPTAARGGLMPRLDALVFDLALGQLTRWDAEGLEPISMSVNLGLESMVDPTLVPQVSTSLRAHGVAPDRVRLEITEHSALPDDEDTTRSLRSLAELGVRLSLDDFGTGYTSLNYLCRYPISMLKLDRSIVVAEATRDQSPLLEGIVGMAPGLNVDVLAEGIETEDQRRRLADIGVTYGQGYLFARPMEGSGLVDLIRPRRPADCDPDRLSSAG